MLSSIALDPLYPSRCSWETFGYATSTSMAQALDGLSPLQLSGQLNSLPCSLTFRQEETISIIRLIEQVGAQAGPGQRSEPAGGGESPCRTLLGSRGRFTSTHSSPRRFSLPQPLASVNICHIWLKHTSCRA